jgi:hypothetical protein
MNLNRRDFLRGLAALTGVAVVGLPEAGAAAPVALPVPPVAFPSAAVPHGHDGYWVELDGVWYVLRDASVDLHRDVDSVNISGVYLEHIPSPLRWQMALELDAPTDMAKILWAGKLVDIRLLTPYGAFRGAGWLVQTETMLDVAGRFIENTVIEGNGPLTHEPA